MDYFFKTGVCVVINSGEVKRGKYSVTEDGWYATVLGYGQMIFDAWDSGQRLTFSSSGMRRTVIQNHDNSAIAPI